MYITDSAEVPAEDIRKFADQLSKEATQQLNESGSEMTEAEMRKAIMDFMSKLQTKEDLDEFIRNNKAQMEGIRKQSAGDKVKTILCKIWDVICKVVKFGAWCIQNIQSIAVLAAIVFVCVKFHVGPLKALSMGWEAAKVVYQAADMTLTGAKKTADAYGAVQDASSSLGDKVGELISGSWFQNRRMDKEIEALRRKQLEIRAQKQQVLESDAVSEDRVDCSGWYQFLEKLGERKQDVCVLEYVFPAPVTASIQTEEGEALVNLTAQGMPLYVTDLKLESSFLVLTVSEDDPGKGKALSDAQFLARTSMLGGLYRKVQVRMLGGDMYWDVVSVKGLALEDVRDPAGIALAPSEEWKQKELEADRWDLCDDQPETAFLDLRFDD